MVEFNLKVVDVNGQVLADKSGEDEVVLVYNAEYAEGDQIVLTSSEHDIHVIWQVDDALGAAMCYVTEDIAYTIPFGEKKKVYSPKTFSGNRHYLYVRVAEEDEISRYRNLALNVVKDIKIIEDHQQRFPGSTRIVQTFIDHTTGGSAITQKCDYLIILLLQRAGSCHAQSNGHGTGGVASHECIGVTFRRLGKTGHTAKLAKMVKVFLPPGQ